MVYDLIEQGALSWETVARECLSYMSEADVADMATAFDLSDDEEEEEEEETDE